MNNFRCCGCDQEFLVIEYKFSIKNGSTIYKYKKTGNDVECPLCSSKNIKYIEKSIDFTLVSIGKYSIKSIEERQNLLKRRSHDHFIKEIKEKKDLIDKNNNLQTLG